jgi:uncharacterized protein with PIN domain
MAQITKYYCDRCNEETLEGTYSIRVESKLKEKTGTNTINMQLCPRCNNTFETMTKLFSQGKTFQVIDMEES